MEHNTDRILWTVLVLAIGVALYIGFRPAANSLLGQVADKIQTVATNVNSNTSDNSSSSSNSHTAVGTNLLKGTSSNLQTATDSSGSYRGGYLHIFNISSSDELSDLAGKVTVRVFIHNTTTHTLNLVMWTDTGNFGVGNGVPAGTDGYSTVNAYTIPSSATEGDISIRAYTENAATSGVQYKELKLENGSVATPWVP